MSFTMSEKEAATAAKYKREHNEKFHGGAKPYTGAIGGQFTYSFTPNSLGRTVTIHCYCGKEPECNVTDFDDW